MHKHHAVPRNWPLQIFIIVELSLCNGQSLNWIRKTEKCIFTKHTNLVLLLMSYHRKPWILISMSSLTYMLMLYVLYIYGNYTRSLYEFAQFDKLKMQNAKKNINLNSRHKPNVIKYNISTTTTTNAKNK